MGNLITKITTNSVQLDESNVSEFVVFEVSEIWWKKVNLKFTLCIILLKQVKKESPAPTQAKNGIFKSFLNIDPRSPSNYIARTPITLFQRNSKFNHKELNESLNLNDTNESVDIDILTAAEQESLNSNKDLTEGMNNDDVDEIKFNDLRTSSEEVDKTSIKSEEVKKPSEDNLMKKIAEKLISAKISEASENKTSPQTSSEVAKKKLKEKNLIFEDDNENLDRFSTPPKKITPNANDRTPLSCVANTQSQSRKNLIKTSTPKSSKIPITRQQLGSASRIPRKI